MPWCSKVTTAHAPAVRREQGILVGDVLPAADPELAMERRVRFRDETAELENVG